LSIKVGIVSAEPSGDLLGSRLIEQIKDKFGDIEVIGVGDGDL
jgi:lipid A disaccharide synthetase